MDAGDRTALIALYRRTGGDAWLQNTGWCTDAPFSQWHGVSVNEEGRVVGLDLSHNNLVGKIPRELGSLHNLEELYLHHNKLRGEIPRELGSLPNLEELYLHHNMLRGEIPRELGSLHNLKVLYISGNKLTGEIPKELGSLHNLEGLYLHHNKLTGEIPTELGSLHNLKLLYISENELTGEIPRELSSLHNLKELHLSGNKVTGEIPKEMGSLHNLEGLYLHHNKLTGEIPRELGSLHNLQWLYLNHNKLTGAIPAQLVKLHSLWRLDLAGNNFSGPLPSSKQLKDLFDALARTDSGNEEPPVYSGMTGLSKNRPIQKAASSASTAVTASMTASSLSEPPVYSDITGLSEKGPTQKAASSARTAVTASMTASSLSEPPVFSGITHLEWEELQEITDGQRRDKLRRVTARVSGASVYGTNTRNETLQQASDIWQETNIPNDTRVRLTDFEGDVMAWSFGSTSEAISCLDFELEVPRLARNVPAIIGQSPSEAEMVDRGCLLHPVVTCLAGSEEIFNPPLLLRFLVGDAVESGSDVGGSNEDEESYKADLNLRFSAVKREEGNSKWVPIVGEIKKMDSGVFVLEAQVSHFTDYALRQAPLSLPWSVSIGKGEVEKIEDKKLRNVSLFENKGDKTIVLYYWHRRTRRFWTPSFRTTLKVSLIEVGGGVDREILDYSTAMVYDKFVPSNKSVALNNTKSLEVAWATLKQHPDHREVTVWGWDTMGPREAVRVGPLPERVYARVARLRIADDEDVGTCVRASLGKFDSAGRGER